MLAAYNSNTIDIFLLNKHFDEAREELAEAAKKAILNAIIKRDLPKLIPIEAALKAISSDDFKQTTASDKDYFQTRAEGVSMRISGTNDTAHAKMKKNEDKSRDHEYSSAFRVIHYAAYDAERGIEPASDISIQARVPSIAVPKIADDEDVIEIARKFKVSYEALSKQMGGYTKSMTYNLLTSIHWIDRQHQTLSQHIS